MTIIDYVKKENKSFKELPFNDVDSLILSALSYLDIASLLKNKKSITLKDLNKRFFDDYLEGKQELNKWKSFLDNIILNERYNTLVISNYYYEKNVPEESEFKAMTFENDEFLYVAYMGTSSSLISWKEDFNMSYMCPVYSQKLAAKYLRKILFRTRKDIYVGGHSKGGNLAIYAAYKSLLLRYKIKKVYNHDGPGFPKKVINSIAYKTLEKKINKTIPSSSIIGMLLYSSNNYKIVKSNTIGIMQHSQFSWLISKNDFIYLDELAYDCKFFNEKVSRWVESVDDEKKKVFIDTIYNILRDEYFNKIDLGVKNWLGIYKTINKGTKELDDETKEMVIEVFDELKHFMISK